jgi:hypothetical protein
VRSPVATPSGRTIGELEGQVHETAREASPWIEALGRFGYASKGIVYLIVGMLAVQAAFGRGGDATDQQGALARVAEAPFGRVLLAVLAIGLLGYALWRFVQSALDTENKGSDGKGLVTRAAYAGVGVIYVGFALSAARIALGGDGGEGSSRRTQDWTAWLLGQPMGGWLVGLAGAAVIGNGLFQLYRAYGSTLRDKLRLDEMDSNQVTWVTRIGRAGYAARGIAFVLLGGFLLAAALHADPSEARGLDGALASLAGQPFGPYLLTVVAAGLAAYGVFGLVEARYRRMLIR